MCNTFWKQDMYSNLGRRLWFCETDFFTDAYGEVVLMIVSFSFLCSKREFISDDSFFCQRCFCVRCEFGSRGWNLINIIHLLQRELVVQMDVCHWWGRSVFCGFSAILMIIWIKDVGNTFQLQRQFLLCFSTLFSVILCKMRWRKWR